MTRDGAMYWTREIHPLIENADRMYIYYNNGDGQDLQRGMARYLVKQSTAPY